MACGSFEVPWDSGPDGGRDAFVAPDVAQPPDVGSDARHDAAADPGWVAVDGFDPRCNVQLARVPQAASASLVARACADAPGCRELLLPAGYIRIDGVANATRWDTTANTGWFWWFNAPAASVGRRPYVLSDAAGTTTAVVAVDDTHDCYPFQLGAGDGRFALDIHPVDDPGGASVGTGLIAEPLSFTHIATISATDMPNQGTQYMPVGADAIVLNTIAGAQLWHVTPTGATTRLEWGGAAEHYVDDIQGDAVFTSELGATTYVSVSIAGGAVTPLIVPADGSDAFELATDGTNMVWQQGYGRLDAISYDHVEIWTAPYTTERASVVPRRLAASGRANLHDQFDAYGVAVVDLVSTGTPPTDEHYQVVFLDGSPTRTLAMPPGRLMAPLFAGPEEVAMLVYSMGAAVEAVRFYRYDEIPLAH